VEAVHYLLLEYSAMHGYLTLRNCASYI
jgi:hypothetical protein